RESSVPAFHQKRNLAHQWALLFGHQSRSVCSLQDSSTPSLLPLSPLWPLQFRRDEILLFAAQSTGCPMLQEHLLLSICECAGLNLGATTTLLFQRDNLALLARVACNNRPATMRK